MPLCFARRTKSAECKAEGPDGCSKCRVSELRLNQLLCSTIGLIEIIAASEAAWEKMGSCFSSPPLSLFRESLKTASVDKHSFRKFQYYYPEMRSSWIASRSSNIGHRATVQFETPKDDGTRCQRSSHSLVLPWRRSDRGMANPRLQTAKSS